MTYYVVSRFIEIFKNVHLSIIEQWYKILSLQASMELAFEKKTQGALGNSGVHDERFISWKMESLLISNSKYALDFSIGGDR